MASAPPRSRFGRFIRTSFKIFAYLSAIGLVALGIAVAVAVSQLPSYAELSRRSDLAR